MRSISNTTLRFGPINVPVKVFKATEDNDVKLNIVGPNGEKVKREYVDGSGSVIPSDQLRKAFEGHLIDGDALTKIDDDLKARHGKFLNIEEAIDLTKVPFARVEGAYYLGPNRKMGGERGYKLLLTSLERKGKALTTLWLARSKQHLMVVYPSNGVLMANVLSFAGDWREPDEEISDLADVDLDEREVDLTEQFLDVMAGDGSSLDSLHDEALPKKRELLNDALKGQPIEPIEEPEERAIPDLVAELEKAVAERQTA